MPELERGPRGGVYKALAAKLRQRIADGYYLPGVMLPPEPTLAEAFGVHVSTVRQALVMLRMEGLIVTEPNRGTYVRPKLTPMTVRPEQGREALAVVKGLRPPPDNPYDRAEVLAVEQVPADDELATLFEVREGTPVISRRFLLRLRGRPFAIVESHFLLDLAAGTPLADLTAEAPTSVYAELVGVGVEPTLERLYVSTRMPHADEVERLDIVGVDPLFIITRQIWAGDRVVEVGRDIKFIGSQIVMQIDVDLGGVT